MRIDPRVGSVWLKWDLHAHTPLDPEWINKPDLSTKEKKRDFAKKYVEAALQKELSVIAITDHNFCDKFENLLIPYIKEEADREGITILPGFELTIKEGKGVHILAIFPEDTSLEVIDTIVTKVLPGGSRFYGSSPVASECSLNSFIDILEEFKEARKIRDFLIAFAHANNENGALHEGTIKGEFRVRLWNNNKVKLCQLSKSPMEFEESGFIGQVVRNKTTHYNRPDMAYFIASDCRSLDESNEEGRYSLGEKFTWIKANPTFAGLKQAINEPQERFSWSEPELLKRVRNNPEKFIRCLRINWEKNYKGQYGVWFKNVEIPFNKGLVAIIGNKGNGKSAVADIIGLCANSKAHRYFSFLKEDRFLKRISNGARLASNFIAELIWENEENAKKNLGEPIDSNKKEKVRYLPQNYFEKLAADPSGLDDFKLVLEQIVFEHLPLEKRYGKNNLREVIEFLSNKIRKEIQALKNSMHNINKKIVELETKEIPEYISQLKNNYRGKVKELKQLEEKIKELEIKKKQFESSSKQKDIINALKEIRNKISSTNGKLSQLEQNNIILLKELQEILNLKELIDLEMEKFKQNLRNYATKLKKYGIELDSIIQIKLDLTVIEKLINDKKKILDKNRQEIQNLKTTLGKLKKKEQSLIKNLSSRKEEYERILSDLEYLREKKDKLLGEENMKDSLNWLKKEIQFVTKELPIKKEQLEQERIQVALQIFNKVKEIEELYKEFKKVVDERLFTYETLLEKYGYRVRIETFININVADFKKSLLTRIDKRTKTVFKEDGEKVLGDLIAKTDFSEESSFEEFLKEVNKYLHYYNNNKIYPLSCITGNNFRKKTQNLCELYDFVFNPDNYLEVAYELRLGDKNLHILSPGERGAILLIFYLLLDVEDIPLIIDQPEENLDNESIYKVLVKFIRDVRKRRQVIIITHNPNLAIVADADQIIKVKINRENYEFSYESGAIEDLKINKFASDILEGTLEAFEIREGKYCIQKIR